MTTNGILWVYCTVSQPFSFNKARRPPLRAEPNFLLTDPLLGL